MKKIFTTEIKAKEKYCWVFLLLVIVFANPAFLQAQNTQERVITGKVIDSDGLSVPGVNIVVKGTSNGTITDVDGAYSLKVRESNPVLVFSFVGYTTQEQEVGNQTSIDIKLASEARSLQEVVVTALGVKKELRTIGYSTQEIKGNDLVKAREPNPLNSLTGKVAGLNVGVSAEMLGRPQLLLRGNS